MCIVDSIERGARRSRPGDCCWLLLEEGFSYIGRYSIEAETGGLTAWETRCDMMLMRARVHSGDQGFVQRYTTVDGGTRNGQKDGEESDTASEVTNIFARVQGKDSEAC